MRAQFSPSQLMIQVKDDTCKSAETELPVIVYTMRDGLEDFGRNCAKRMND